MKKLQKVICAVSGGVDSAVAALLLKRKGFDVVGLFMKNWDVADETGRCSSDKDLQDAELVCETLDIKLHQVKFIKQYWNQVFSEMVKDYQNGITPNPDIMCNKHIKFDSLLHHAIENLGGEAIATGHYAQTSIGYELHQGTEKKGVKLLKAADSLKDQTFFLSQISQDALQHAIFPVGGFTKNVVRSIALEAGLKKHVQKKECGLQPCATCSELQLSEVFLQEPYSMGICFVGSRHFQKFIEEYTQPTPGCFIDIETGKVVGTHKGVHYWTVGQRALIAGEKQAYFVVAKNVATQNIIVAPGTDHPALYCQTFTTGAPHWIAGPPQNLLNTHTADIYFRFQHRQPLVSCAVNQRDGHSLGVTLTRPLRAVTPGQYAVFYQGDECLGSARILETGPSLFTMGHNTTSLHSRKRS